MDVGLIILSGLSTLLTYFLGYFLGHLIGYYKGRVSPYIDRPNSAYRFWERLKD